MIHIHVCDACIQSSTYRRRSDAIEGSTDLNLNLSDEQDIGSEEGESSSSVSDSTSEGGSGT